MSATTTAPATHDHRHHVDDTDVRPPLHRVVAVELRKAVDTRASRWLLAITVVLAAGIAGVQVGVSEDQNRNFATLLRGAQTPVALLVPVVAILAVTSEFSTRSLMTTAALVPSRVRLVVAKLLAVLALATSLFVATLVVTALATLVGTVVGDPAEPWAVEPELLGGTLLYQLLLALVGFALGLLLTSSALAIVVYFVLPIVLTALAFLVASLSDPLGWVDLNLTTLPLTTADLTPITGEQWGKIAVTTAAWAVLPLAVGLTRFQRREIG